ncbi:hypothetical protein QYM36_012277 [Artemia franciscana]|uniref:Cuticle protein n=1 Tax=Artemia franciscana TaxID=6661 RepID=A0AA88HNT0_ARTSF|nr:hypothetical protein QYM36_012277 [Artemia franciscana]
MYDPARLYQGVFILVAFIAVAASQSYPKPSYNTPAYKDKYEYRPYSFDWTVKDDPSYNDYGHQQNTDASGNTQGSYRVLLPDGRVQTVSYTVTPYGGYNADVTYSGEYNYKPAYKAPAYKAPAYPAPAYKAPAYPAPAYKAPAYKAPAYPAPAYKAPAYP